MKVLFFSDVHGSPESVTLLRRQIDRLAPEQLVLLGDVLYHGPRNPLRPDYAPQLVVEQLNGLKERITAVRGNCDSEVDQMLLAFPIMSEYATLLADGRRFFLTHGHHWGPGNPPPLPAGAVLACGTPIFRSSRCWRTASSPSTPVLSRCRKAVAKRASVFTKTERSGSANWSSATK